MVENISNQNLNPMEFFLMAAISRGGLKSLYLLQRDAELQPGSIRSALRRLEESGLLARRDLEKRGRRPMVLTEFGEHTLVASWKKCLDPHRELESVFRSATVALLMGEAGTAIGFLSRSAAERSGRVGPADRRPYFTGLHPIDFHAEMREIYSQKRRAMEAELLEALANRLGATIGKMNLEENMPRTV